MWNELKQAPLIWKVIAFVGIPLAAILACTMFGAIGYLVISPSTPQAQPQLVAEATAPAVLPSSDLVATTPEAAPTQPPATATLPATLTPTRLPAMPTPQPEVEYHLNWKIEEGQPIAYTTTMDITKNEMTVDYDRIFPFSSLGEESGVSFDELAKEFQDIQPSYSLVSILDKKSEDKISVKIVVDSIEGHDQSTGNAMEQWLGLFLQEGMVHLQGEVTPEGEVVSPYMAQQQKNYLALFFQLPVGPVKVGDNWSIDLTCLILDSSQFAIEKSERLNQVTLKEVTETAEGEPVAILDYTLIESVEGQQRLPFSSAEAVPSTMKCSFLGRGEFLLEQGRWKAFSAENLVQSTGIVTADVAQHLALTPLPEVPVIPTPDLRNQPSLEEIFSQRRDSKTCEYRSEQVIGPNEGGTMTFSSYLPEGENLWTATKTFVLQLADILPPDELLLGGKKFVRSPFDKAVNESPSLPFDSSNASEPVITLMLTFPEQEIQDPITLSFAGKEYLLRLDDQMNEYCRK